MKATAYQSAVLRDRIFRGGLILAALSLCLFFCPANPSARSSPANAQARPAFDSGDGTPDIGIFRPSSGLWAIRGVSRLYFGGPGDEPIGGDFDGDGVTEIGIFRPETGLWAIRGFTRCYFGREGDISYPAGEFFLLLS